MNKYEVFYHSYWFGHSTIHVFAKSAEEAIEIVKRDGVGYADGRTQFPDSIGKARCVEIGK